MVVSTRGGGVKTPNIRSSRSDFQFSARAAVKGGGYVWHIQKALEKGFSDMYGLLGGRPPQKKVIQPATWTGQGFWAIFGNLRGPVYGFDLVWVIFSSFQPRTPLEPCNWVKPRPEMESAPSK